MCIRDRDGVGLVRIEWPVTRVTVGLDACRYLRRRLPYRVLQISQVVVRKQAHGRVGGQYVEALVDRRIVGHHQHLYVEAMFDRVQLL